MNQELAQVIVEAALRQGAQEAEVYMRSNKGFSVGVKEQQVDSIESFKTSGYGVRVIKDMRVGFSYSTDLQDYKKVVGKAIASSLYVDAQDTNSLPERAYNNTPIYVDVFDPEIETLKEQAAIDSILYMESCALENPLVKKIRNAEGSFGLAETLIANSKGVSCYYRSSSASAEIMLAAERDKDSSVGMDYQYCRHIRDLDFGAIGKRAAERASMLLGAKKINGCRVFALLDSAVVVDFLKILSSSFISDSVQKGRSLLANKIGRPVISPKVDIIDSGIVNRMVGSSPFDAEGVSTRETCLIEGGVLKGYLYNSHTAAKDNVNSTGNARRSRYSSMPFVGINNLLLKATSSEPVYCLDDMITKMKRGIYVLETIGMHTADPVSGDFSVGVSGIWIEGGERAYPFKETLISGNILSFLSSIELIGDDHRFYGNMSTPSVLIAEIDMSA